ncbi:electron transport complex subunit RsxG [Inmirania thermothiophila]|uniref:Ion-translocating oxidoreductase complex subunit G n=1 Tax=Inmirania thermothiophila TaxID=1750597 RepID=A0A3N1YBL3_9GAMM|nr:electron transport complex subunit RsxG [Inmirania thermothiophila]ROR35052.1 electron transport complex protein RnfG [Inmirania thermothiophila]
MAARHMSGAALVLAGFALVGTGLVAATYGLTRERIAQVERENLLRTLGALVPPEWYDNDLAGDTLQVRDRALLGTDEPVTVYRARRGGAPVAVVLTPVAPDGYGGPIRLMVAIRVDGTLAGVRVLAHKETPGLGDRIEVEKSDWIHAFRGRSLRDPDPAHWKVRKDGGVFDQFTGATITPRAVVKAVRKALEYYEAHRNELFAAQPEESRDG